MNGQQRVTMTKTMPGSEDGIRVREYVKGATYELGDALAQSFIDSKCGVPAKEPKDKDSDGSGKGADNSKKGKGPDENK